MNMKVGDLQALLARVDAEADVIVALNGDFAAIVGVVSAPGGPFAIIRGRGKDRGNSSFSITEEGMIGRLAHLGATDEEIAEVLGRSADSVKRKRKALGFG